MYSHNCYSSSLILCDLQRWAQRWQHLHSFWFFILIVCNLQCWEELKSWQHLHSCSLLKIPHSWPIIKSLRCPTVICLSFSSNDTALPRVKFESFCPQMGVMHCFCYWWCIMIVAMHLKRADYRGFTEQARVTKGWNTGNLGANAFIFGGARQNYIQVRISKYIHALTTSWVNQVFIFSSSVFISVCQIVDRIQSMW